MTVTMKHPYFPQYKKSPYGLNAVNSYGENVYYQNNDIANTISPQKNFYGSKLQFLSQNSGLQQGPDPFYSPIIQKIDEIFIQMGYSDEGCRERLVCSMYKNPHRFSPHSNLLSNELSRYCRAPAKQSERENLKLIRRNFQGHAAKADSQQRGCPQVLQVRPSREGWSGTKRLFASVYSLPRQYRGVDLSFTGDICRRGNCDSNGVIIVFVNYDVT